MNLTAQKFKQQIRNQRGMNLVELMISVFIIMLSSAAMMMLSANQSAVTQFTRKQESRNTVASFVRSVASTPGFIYYSAQMATNGNGATENQKLADCVLGQSTGSSPCEANVEFPIALYIPDDSVGRISGPGGSSPNPVMYTDHIAKPCTAAERAIGDAACPLAVTTTAIARCPLNAASCKQAQMVEVKFNVENRLQAVGSAGAKSSSSAIATTLRKVTGAYQTDTSFVAQYKSQKGFENDNNKGCDIGEVALGVDGLGNLFCQKIDNLCPAGTYTVGLDRYMRPINDLNSLKGQYAPGLTVQCKKLDCGVDPVTNKPYNMISMFQNGSITPECLRQNKICSPVTDAVVLHDVNATGEPICAWLDTCDEANRGGLEVNVADPKTPSATNRMNFTRAFQFYNGGVQKNASTGVPEGGVKSVCEAYGCGLNNYMTTMLSDGQCRTVTSAPPTSNVVLCVRNSDGTFNTVPQTGAGPGCQIPVYSTSSYSSALSCVTARAPGTPSSFTTISSGTSIQYFNGATAACISTSTACDGSAISSSGTPAAYPGGITNASQILANDFVTTLYCGILDRPPETAGFDHWTTKLKTGSMDAANVAYCGFLGSVEYLTRTTSPSCLYPCLKNPGREPDQVEMYYRGMLGRSAEPAGKAHWIAYINNLASQGLPRQTQYLETAKGFVFSPEFIMRTTAMGLNPGNGVLSCNTETCDYQGQDILVDWVIPGTGKFPVAAWVGADLGALPTKWCQMIFNGTGEVVQHDEQASTRIMNDTTTATRININNLHICNIPSEFKQDGPGQRPYCELGTGGSTYLGYVFDKIRCRRVTPTGQSLNCPTLPAPGAPPAAAIPPPTTPPAAAPPPATPPATQPWARWCRQWSGNACVASRGLSCREWMADGNRDAQCIGGPVAGYNETASNGQEFRPGAPGQYAVFTCYVHFDGTQPTSECTDNAVPTCLSGIDVGGIVDTVETGGDAGNTVNRCCGADGSVEISNCVNPQGGSCFIAGTKVRMKDGSHRGIETLQPGDEVVNSSGGFNQVVGIETPPLGTRKLYRINGGKAFVTAEHPFMTTSGWKAIDPNATEAERAGVIERLNLSSLKVGDVLVTESGAKVPIRSIEAVTRDPKTTVYNLLLDGDHTYFADGYLVHNKEGAPAL